MICRRLFLASAGSLILAHRTWAVQSTRVWRIGYLATSVATDNAPYFDAFREALQTLGYIEGQNLLI